IFCVREADIMDHLINILVKFFVFLSRFAPALSKLGLINYKSYDGWESGKRLNILLVGYNGARNTGADVRVAEITRQLQEQLGKDNIQISIMTLDEKNIRGYFDSDIRLIHFSPIFFGDLFKACCANQAVILCEGSTLKSKFANALTLYFCEAAGIMKNQHKPCIAFGSEAGEMDTFLERTVRKLCVDTYFIARTQNSLDQIFRLGLKGHLGTDAAWKFNSTTHTRWAAEQLKQSGWDGISPLLGIAPVNPFWWPVKPSLAKWLKAGITGNHSLQFQLWYFFSWSKVREQQFEDYLDAIALSVNKFATEHSCHVVILGMERLDTDACIHLQAKLTVPVSVILSSEHDGFEMAAILRQLSMLITSRYHAQVLSMAAKVPGVAVSMDERLDNIIQEMDMSQHQLLHTDDTNLASELMNALEYVYSHQEYIRSKIDSQLAHYQSILSDMEHFLAEWLLTYQATHKSNQ
ncbi:MAG: polysaccharide pyruvyl transferase family protein, partial [Clostridiales bacterium]|nr:polysaccharide pyruvyl transferase family protein [Clostridiales bacterium]